MRWPVPPSLPEPERSIPPKSWKSTEGGYSRLEKIYHLTAADDPADIPTADFEREGYQYTLLDLTRTDKAETDTKYYSETVTFESSSKDMDTILPQLAATCEADTEERLFRHPHPGYR